MRRAVVSLLKRLFYRAGLDVRVLSPSHHAVCQVARSLGVVGANVVVDIGANEGQFARDLRLMGYAGNILSIEPIEACHARLHAFASHDPNWEVGPRCCIGETTGEVLLNVAANTESSSLLGIEEKHIEAEPASVYVRKEPVSMRRLDDLLSERGVKLSTVFLKLDVQGYESRVLDGAPCTLEVCRGVYLELSLCQLYVGQPEWREMIDRLESHGLTLWGVQNGFTDPRDGRSLQVDALFIREDVGEKSNAGVH